MASEASLVPGAASILNRVVAIRSVHNGGYLDSRDIAKWGGMGMSDPVKVALKDPLDKARHRFCQR